MTSCFDGTDPATGLAVLAESGNKSVELLTINPRRVWNR